MTNVSDTMDWELVQKTDFAKFTAKSLSPSAKAAIQGFDTPAVSDKSDSGIPVNRVDPSPPNPLLADPDTTQVKQSSDEIGFSTIAEGAPAQPHANQFHRGKHQTIPEGESTDDIYLDYH